MSNDRVFLTPSEKGSSPTALGVIRPKTANPMGLLPLKRSSCSTFREISNVERFVRLYIKRAEATGFEPTISGLSGRYTTPPVVNHITKLASRQADLQGELLR